MRNLWVLTGRLAFWVAWPLLFIYLLRGERTRVIVRCGGEVLVVKGWLGSGHWILPGGGLHIGEEASAGAMREVLEETAVALREEQLHYIGVFDAARGLRFRYHLFVAELDSKPAITPQRFEIIDLAWMTDEVLRTGALADVTTVEALQTWSGLDDLIQ
jgi:8-oxo-dGTP pyrophosphatase MutT (NUDIX family)